MAGCNLTFQSLNRPSKNLDLETETAIKKAVQACENAGNKPTTIKKVKNTLKRLTGETDLFDTTKLLQYLAHAKVRNHNTGELTNKDQSDPYKMQTADIYAIFCEVNNIAFKKPKYTRKCPIPIIPRTEHVEAIIASSSKRMATIFRILSETAIEGYELEIIPQKQIDPEQGIISVVGVKRHLNGTYTLKTETAEMLRQYLAKHPEEYPFPKVKNIREAWMNSRKTTANKLGNPQIAKIPLKNLRNYAGAIFYLTMGKDPMQTMYFMRHSNLKTTTDYLRGLKEFTAKTELISKLVTTPEEALELINQGFKETSIFAQGTPNEKHILTEIQKIDVSEGVEERRESEQTKNRYEQLKTVMNLIYEGEKIE